MTLTPQDVRNKLFTSVRFRQGYDEDEVDAFLDEVEGEFTRLLTEIEQLRAGLGPVTDPQLAAVRADADARLQRMLDEAREQHEREMAALRAEHAQALAQTSTQTAAQTPAADGPAAVSPEVEAARREADALVARATEQARVAQAQVQDLSARLEQAQQQAEAATRRAQAAGTEIARRGGEPAEVDRGTGQLVSASPTEDALRRTLVLAQRTADEAIAEARAEAQRIVTEAHRQAADTISRVEVEHQAIVQRRTAEQQQLMTKLEELRSFERDYRSRLRAYLHLQLRDLEAGAPEPPRAQVSGVPRQALTVAAVHADDVEPAEEQPLRPAPLYGERSAEGVDG